jgi:hypothetical protein
MIVSAAVKYHLLPLESVEDEIIMIVHRHCECLSKLKARGYRPGIDFEIVEEGFLTDTEKFLDRREAADHAYECGQLVETAEEPRIDRLMSEDLW